MLHVLKIVIPEWKTKVQPGLKVVVRHLSCLSHLFTVCVSIRTHPRKTLTLSAGWVIRQPKCFEALLCCQDGSDDRLKLRIYIFRVFPLTLFAMTFALSVLILSHEKETLTKSTQTTQQRQRGHTDRHTGLWGKQRSGFVVTIRHQRREWHFLIYWSYFILQVHTHTHTHTHTQA